MQESPHNPYVSRGGRPRRRRRPRFARRPARLHPALLFAILLVLPGRAVADGDERLGPPLGVDLPPGTRIAVAGTGLNRNPPPPIVLELPGDARVRRVLLYWGARTAEPDDTVEVEGIPVRGRLIGRSTCNGPPSYWVAVHRADITELGLVGPGRNEIAVTGLDVSGNRSRQGGAEIAVFYESAAGSPAELEVRDGSDFAFYLSAPPCDTTERQRFEIDPAPYARDGRLILVVGDQEPEADPEDVRPTALEVEIDLDGTYEYLNVLIGSDGPQWDTVELPVTVPPLAASIAVQLFSEDRSGESRREPSSFYWIFAALEIENPSTFRLDLPELLLGEGEAAPVPVRLDALQPVEGFTVAVRHDPAVVELLDVTIEGTATEEGGAEFFAKEIEEEGGTAGVVFDLEPPFAGQTLPPGEGIEIARFVYRAREGAAGRSAALVFADDELGTPSKRNIVVVRGRAVRPELDPGRITVNEVRREGPLFECGGPPGETLGVPVGSVPPAAPGERSTVCLYYTHGESGTGGGEEGGIQGLSIVLCYDCDLEFLEPTFRTPPGSILDALGAEYVSFQVDNDPSDGDGCEAALGVLVDALPPFDGRTLPAAGIPLALGCVEVEVRSDAPCDRCLPIRFCDGADGRGKVPLKNLASIANRSVPARLESCELCTRGRPRFHRGDCNAMNGVEIADAAAVVSALFLPGSWRFEPLCLDACDANDDGRLDLADAAAILRYLFLLGVAPPPPGPGFDPETGAPIPPGPDPTPDKLDCNLRPCP